MAFYDWNKDGKNNNTDNYIENEIYKKFSENENYKKSNEKKKFSVGGAGKSNIGAVCITVVSLFAVAGITSNFDLKKAVFIIVSIVVISVVTVFISTFFN